jgi:hypothetical protein
MLEGEGDTFQFQTRTPNSKLHEGDFTNRTSDVDKITSWTTRMSYKNDEGLKAHGDRRQQTTMTRKISVTVDIYNLILYNHPLAINCSSIICHSTSSIPVEGEYRLSILMVGIRAMLFRLPCGTTQRLNSSGSQQEW